MRTAVRGGLLFVCLGLAGCGLTGKRPGAQDAGSKPFLGTNPGAGAAAGGTAAAANPPSAISGILAGQVMDRFNRRQPGAFIQVVDLGVPQQGNSAKIEIAADGQGYFTILGLQTSHHYQLIARAKDGDKVLTGTTLAMPPNPRLSIFISDDLTTPTTPPVPGAPAIPGRSAPEKEEKPAAVIDPPNKAKPEASGTSAPPPAALSPAPPSDPSKVVVEPGGFARIPSSPAAIPNPPPENAPAVIPPAPITIIPAPVPAPIAPANPIGPSTQLPGAAPPVPYCVLVGRKLDNFALYGLDGQPWEFRRDHTGRLILMDFWYSSCAPCLQAMPHLVELQRQYGSFGLEVVGVAYEKGKIPEQVQKVRAVRGRYNVPYTTLLGGGGPGPCPVQTQFEINVFPTMVLLDESGQILWRGEGLDARQRWELETEIRRRLGIKPR